MTEEEKEEKKKKKKEMYDPTKRIDEVSPARRNVLVNFANRDPNDMYRYYLSRVGRLNEYYEKVKDLAPIKKRLDELMGDKNKSLRNPKRMDAETWEDYYLNIEGIGEIFDEHGYLKDKYQELKGLDGSDIQTNYNYDTLHNLIDDLFEPGNDGIMAGAKGDGKSNYALNLALEGIKKNYIVCTNIGILKNHDYQYLNEYIIKTTWMTDLLRIVAKNKIKNMTYLKKGLYMKIKYIICIIDEGEQFMSSISRKTDSSGADYSKFSQLTRKMDLAMLWIFHRFKDCPKTFRESPNLTYRIWKGIDQENNKLENPKEKAIIEFVGEKRFIHVTGITANPILDTNGTGGFDIYDKKFLDKSVDIDEVLRICKDEETENVPHAILKYLDEVKLENQSIENLYEIANRIYEEMKTKIYNCKTEKEFYTLAKRWYQEKYKLADISIIKNAEKSLKTVIKDKWELFKIGEREEKNKSDAGKITSDLIPKHSSIEVLKIWLLRNNTKKVKAVVDLQYRKFDKDEIDDLLSCDVSKSKVLEVYGNPCRDYVLYSK